MSRVLRISWLLVPAVGITACSAREQAAARPDSAAVQAAAPAAPNVVTVHAKDFAFDAPAQIPAGMTTFHLVNDGPSIHHMQIIRLDSARTIDDLKAALAKPGPMPAWAVAAGGPNAPDPGSESNTTMDMAAGSYAIVCFVDIPGGVPHFTKGMFQPLTVAPSSAVPVAAPTPDVTISLTDYAFTLSQPVTAGMRTFAVQASGQSHEVELIRLAPGKTARDMMAWMQKPVGPPPGSGVGGVAALTPGSTPVYFTANMTPADYMLICFLPDRKDGKPHFMKGMMQTITVD